jgi:tocopherol cyclase
MIQKFLNIWRPEVYHGAGEKANFFEGWFYKLVDPSGENILAVIPGVFIGRDRQESHAFIQILDGKTHRSTYHSYPFSQFQTSSRNFKIDIGPNSFSKNHLNLDLPQNPKLWGQLTFEQLQNWPVRWSSPGAMGWYSFVPYMECYHGILSLDHRISGELQWEERLISFENGRGYIEKDWGRSFPQAYIWMQCNHFGQQAISLTLSVAKIPWLKSSFRGFIIGFLFENRIYRFTTYNGAQLKQVIVDREWVKVEVFNRRHRLQVRARRTETGTLQGPFEKQMLRRVAESLSSTVTISFYEKNGNEERLLFSGTGNNAGLEVNGALEQILDNKPM